MLAELALLASLAGPALGPPSSQDGALAPAPTPLERSAEEFLRRNREEMFDFTIRRMEYVIFHQDISAESVDWLSDVLGQNEILDVQSLGGDARASFEMARMARERRARVRVTGECSSGCAIVWITARERLINGFTAITFHGSPISSLAWFRDHPDSITADELEFAEEQAGRMTSLLEEAGISPWLFLCAARLQNATHTYTPNRSTNPGTPITTTAEYRLVWFPRSILEHAGVRGLERYDEPNARQRLEIETEHGTRSRPKEIYWAKDGDCDQERMAAAS